MGHYITGLANRARIPNARPSDTFSCAHKRIREAFPDLHSSKRKALVTSGEIPTVEVAGVKLVCNEIFDLFVARLRRQASGEAVSVADQPPEMADA